MMKKIITSLILIILLTACNQNPGGEKPSVEMSLAEKHVEQAKNAVSATLKDPSSAQFRNIREVSAGILCGEVNAKNAFGGYVGFKRFQWLIIAPDYGNILSDTDTRCK